MAQASLVVPPCPTLAVLRTTIRRYFSERFREPDVVIEGVWVTSPSRCYVRMRKIGHRSGESERPLYDAREVQVAYDIHPGVCAEIMEV